MADNSLRVEIATPDGTDIYENVSYIMIPAEDGLLGIAPGRVPLMAACIAGTVTLTQNGETREIPVNGGVFWFENGTGILLGDKS